MFADGFSAMLSGCCGSCPITAYGENTGVMAITRVYSIWVIGGAAIFPICLSGIAINLGQVQLKVMSLAAVVGMLLGLVMYIPDKNRLTNEYEDADESDASEGGIASEIKSFS